MFSFFNRLTRTILKGEGAFHPAHREELSNRQIAEMMEGYYYNNDLYEAMAQYFRDNSLWKEPIQALRNPTFAAVEFYTSTVMPGVLPGALPITTDNEKIVEPIWNLWKWSNWDAKKDFAVRQLCISGELFLRVSNTVGEKRVYLQVIESKNISEFDVDERGNIKYIRYEVKRKSQVGEKGREVTYTEVWDSDGMMSWEHTKGFDQKIKALGVPMETRLLSESDVDWIPWVYAKFRDDGHDRGLPMIWTMLSKIDEVNRKCTRLAQILFRYNKPIWALQANLVDKEGRPMPAPTLGQQGTTKGASETVQFHDDQMFRLPGNTTLVSLIPNLDYSSYRQAILDDILEVERDLPEVRFYNVMTEGALSGRALLVKLAPAVGYAKRVRAIVEGTLIKAHKMALTLGQNLGVEGFKGIGEYEDGDFDHQFDERDVLPISPHERVETVARYVDMGVPLSIALKRYDRWTNEEIENLEEIIGIPDPDEPPEIQALKQQVIVEAGARDIATQIESVIAVVADGAIDQLLKTGALERTIKLKQKEGSEGNGAR